ncbi:hypothetical protein EDD69_1251 [Thermolongibacillus altinsuensis]|uniref:Uncharacterized protein n=1 Tax=Thermolongibacillus altinsuensis TaxID=575256 RepID=A0A4V2Q9K9_9BACL|nr:hypothetical protein [Thermolongibacillus altinsuensis]TCL43944.1 hypothetical protein EDD69_1251 [Thermolongibacillus altinsuensis]
MQKKKKEVLFTVQIGDTVVWCENGIVWKKFDDIKGTGFRESRKVLGGTFLDSFFCENQLTMAEAVYPTIKLDTLLMTKKRQ